jgi:hypothetical protein
MRNPIIDISFVFSTLRLFANPLGFDFHLICRGCSVTESVLGCAGVRVESARSDLTKPFRVLEYGVKKNASGSTGNTVSAASSDIFFVTCNKLDDVVERYRSDDLLRNKFCIFFATHSDVYCSSFTKLLQSGILHSIFICEGGDLYDDQKAHLDILLRSHGFRRHSSRPFGGQYYTSTDVLNGFPSSLVNRFGLVDIISRAAPPPENDFSRPR